MFSCCCFFFFFFFFFFTSADINILLYDIVRKFVRRFCFFLIVIFILFHTKLYQQIVGIPLGTNCDPRIAGMFRFCYKRNIMLSLSHENQTNIIEASNSTSRYLDDLNIDKKYFEHMVNTFCKKKKKKINK